jgi:peptidoglycan/LPS O-acetylase OafA/YrhL
VVSYSLYLWHHPVLEWLHWLPAFQALSAYKLPVLIALGLPTALLVAALSYALVERPFINLRRR